MFPGYIGLDLVSSAGTTHEVVYRSRASSNCIKRNMYQASKELGWVSTVYQDGSLFTLHRSAIREDQVDNTAPVSDDGGQFWSCDRTDTTALRPEQAGITLAELTSGHSILQVTTNEPGVTVLLDGIELGGLPFPERTCGRAAIP